MDGYDVFVSVGATASEKQESFVRSVEDRLRSEGIIPHTVGRNIFGADSPLKTVMELMDRCHGVVVIALERTYFPAGIEKRGGVDQSSLSDARYATPWNQIEAAMACACGIPLMVIMERGLREEGLLSRGYDWYVQRIEPTTAALATVEFNGVLSSWKEKVVKHAAPGTGKSEAQLKSVADLTVGELVSGMKAGQLWSVLGALAALIGGAFVLGAKLFVSHVK